MLDIWNSYFSELPNEFQMHFKKNCKLQKLLVNYIDSTDEDDSVNYQIQFSNLTDFIKNNKINSDIHDLRSFVLLLSILTNKIFLPNQNHFSRIQKILLFYKKEICMNIPNEKLIKYFSKSNHMILFLYQNDMIDLFHPQIIDNFFSKDKIENIEFFYPEIKKKILQSDEQKNDKNAYNNIKNTLNLPFLNFLTTIGEDFVEKRNQGINDDPLAEIIRNDSIDMFIKYKEKTEMDINATLSGSLFEGNLILSRSSNSLIEYSAFYGSIQIFKYLYTNKAKLSSKTWICAICSQNYEIIHILEDDANAHSFIEFCFIDSIALYCNDIAYYLFENHLNGDINDKLFIECLKSFNLLFLKNILLKNESNEPKTIENENLPAFNSFLKNVLETFCIYDHYHFIDILSNMNNPVKIDMNMKFEISNLDFLLFFILILFIWRIISFLYKTPLHVAVINDHLEVVKLLLNNPNVKINEVDDYFQFYIFNFKFKKKKLIYQTPFQYSINNGNIEIIKLFLSNKDIDINHQDSVLKLTIFYCF